MVLEQILRIESILKSTIAYVFAKNHTDGDYLNKNNFNANFVEKRKYDDSIIFTTDKVINELGDCLSEQIDKKSKMICHYQQKYNRVPIWVFVNVLTLGLVSKLYAIMQQHDQVEVCKQISYLLGIELFPYDLTKYLVNLVYIRNLCAHNQRLYDLKTNMQLSTKSKFMKELGLSKQPKGIFLLLIIIRNLSRKEEFNNFFLKFIENINYLREGISSIDTEGIIKKMGLIEKDKWFKLYLP